MKEATFMFVFSIPPGGGTNPDGTKRLVPYGTNITSFPEPATLAAAGFTPTETRRRITFKISVPIDGTAIKAADVKKIQNMLNKLLPSRISSYRRIWSEALKASSNSDAARDRLMAVISAKIPAALAAYAAFNAAPPGPDVDMGEIPNVPAQAVPVDQVIEVNAGPAAVPPPVAAAVVEELEWGGEGAFIASQGQGDELANLFGGLAVAGEEGVPEFGGKKRRRKTRRGKGKRGTRRYRRR
jgi:hypothetical protein